MFTIYKEALTENFVKVSFYLKFNAKIVENKQIIYNKT